MMFPSAKGAKCKSLGHRPRDRSYQLESAEGAKCRAPIVNQKNFFATVNIARLQRSCRCSHFPGAMPQAFAFRAFGAANDNVVFCIVPDLTDLDLYPFATSRTATEAIASSLTPALIPCCNFNHEPVQLRTFTRHIVCSTL